MAKHSTLSPCGLGTAFGTLFGLDMLFHVLFAMNNWEFLWYNRATWTLAMSLFPWMQATFAGLLIAVLAGFLCGALCGVIVSWVYNKVVTGHCCGMCK